MLKDIGIFFAGWTALNIVLLAVRWGFIEWDHRRRLRKRVREALIRIGKTRTCNGPCKPFRLDDALRADRDGNVMSRPDPFA